MKLLYQSLANENNATLTASDENPEYPAANLKSLNYSNVWRSTGADAVARTITIDMFAAVAADAIALGNLNLRSTATVTIAAHTADSWGAPAFGPLAINCTSLGEDEWDTYTEFGSTKTYRYWQITVTDNGNDDGFIEIGEVFIGMHVNNTDTFDENPVREVIRPNVEMRTEYNQAMVYERDWHFEFTLSFTNKQTATMNELRALERAVSGNARPFFFVFDDVSTPHLVYFVRMSPAGFKEQFVDFDIRNAYLKFIQEQPGLNVPR